MKSVFAFLRPYLAICYFTGATVLFFVSLDVFYSLLAHLKRSLIHDISVSIPGVITLWIFVIESLWVFAWLQSLAVNRQAGKKTVILFIVLFIILAIMLAAAYDVMFSHKLGIAQSILFNLQAKKSVFALIAFPGIALLIPFSILYHKVICVEVDPDITRQAEKEEN
jgi:hypothetical protein